MWSLPHKCVPLSCLSSRPDTRLSLFFKKCARCGHGICVCVCVCVCVCFLCFANIAIALVASVCIGFISLGPHWLGPRPDQGPHTFALVTPTHPHWFHWLRVGWGIWFAWCVYVYIYIMYMCVFGVFGLLRILFILRTEKHNCS